MFLRCLGLYASAFLLCAVALERCLCLLRPVWARLKRPFWAVPLVCGVLWLMAFIFSVPYIYFAELKKVSGKYHCVESGNFNLGLFLTETIAGFILPLMVFVASNLAVLLTINKAMPSTPSGTTPSMARKMTRMYHVLFSTMVLFLTCWVPYFVCRFVQALAEDKSVLYYSAQKAAYICLFLVYIKSALNPVLYVFAARGLGRAIKNSLVSTIERLFNEESYESIRRKSLKTSQIWSSCLELFWHNTYRQPDSSIFYPRRGGAPVAKGQEKGSTLDRFSRTTHDNNVQLKLNSSLEWLINLIVIFGLWEANLEWSLQRKGIWARDFLWSFGWFFFFICKISCPPQLRPFLLPPIWTL